MVLVYIAVTFRIPFFYNVTSPDELILFSHYTNCRLQLYTTHLYTYPTVACNYNYDWNVAFATQFG